MAEDTTVPQSEDGTPATTPVPSQDEIRQMVEAEAQRVVDARIPGLQAAYEKQLSALRKKLEQAEADPSGYQTSADTELQAELERTRREAAALRAGRQYPNAFPLYEALMSAGTAEEQMELLEGIVQGRPAQAQPEQPPAGSTPAEPQEADVPPVDRNNPPAEQQPYTGETFESVEQAMGLIGQFKTWPKFGRG